MAAIEGIKQIDLTEVDVSAFKQQNTGCIVLTHDNRILLQYRPDNWRTFPGMVATFGGHIESTEFPLNTIVRELNEELGATAKPDDLISLGVVTEVITQHTDTSISTSGMMSKIPSQAAMRVKLSILTM